MGQLRSGGNSPGLGGAAPGGAAPGARPTTRSSISSNVGGIPGKEDNLETDSMKGRREAWYYRKERLPQGVPYKDVRFDFLTKEGYGTNVLQKESEPMQTFGIAIENARKNKRLN